MEITIKKELTGKNDYHNKGDNLLTKTFDSMGYINTYMQDSEWNASKTYLWGIIEVKKEGFISAKANNILYQLSLTEKKNDVTLKLDEE